MSTHAFSFLSSLRARWAAVIALAFAATLLGANLTAADTHKTEAKAEAVHADHGGAACTSCCAAAPSWQKQFGYAYLTAYMFCLSFCLGALFLVLLNHLFDAQWMLPIRRFLEHIACLLCPTMAVLWIPIGALAPHIFP